MSRGPGREPVDVDVDVDVDDGGAVDGLPPKAASLHVLMAGLWALTTVWFDQRLLALLYQATSLLGAVTVGLFTLCLNLFWLFGSYYLATFALSFVRDRLPRPRHLPADPRVAVLYLTRNDFQAGPARSCVELDYPAGFHVFVLDDSTGPEFRAQVDGFQEQFPDRVTVVRRPDRRGFKAGSINHALESHCAGFPYVAVADSDSVLPPEFLSGLMPYFALGDRVAFVQGSHTANPRQPSRFAADLAGGIRPLWDCHYPPRNRYGLMIFLGHGGIVRRDVLDLVGGFPEGLSEDLSFSTRARELGWRGWFVRDVVSFEDFPATYLRFRHQQERYVKGVCEFVDTGFFGSFMRSPAPTWVEKADLLLWCSSLFLPLLSLLFLVTLGILMPLSFGEAKTLHLAVLGHTLDLWPVYPVAAHFQSIWTWDFYAVTVAMVLAPVLGVVKDAPTHPWRTARLLLKSCVPYLSMLVASACWVLSYVTTRTVRWDATGDTPGAGSAALAPSGARPGEPALVRAAELAVGIALTLACVVTMNVGLLVFSLSVLLGARLARTERGGTQLGPAMLVPYLLLAANVSSIGAQLLGWKGIAYVLFPFHF